jgi:hypothetical protein
MTPICQQTICIDRKIELKKRTVFRAAEGISLEPSIGGRIAMGGTTPGGKNGGII